MILADSVGKWRKKSAYSPIVPLMGTREGEAQSIRGWPTTALSQARWDMQAEGWVCLRLQTCSSFGPLLGLLEDTQKSEDPRNLDIFWIQLPECGLRLLPNVTKMWKAGKQWMGRAGHTVLGGRSACLWKTEGPVRQGLLGRITRYLTVASHSHMTLGEGPGTRLTGLG